MLHSYVNQYCPIVHWLYHFLILCCDFSLLVGFIPTFYGPLMTKTREVVLLEDIFLSAKSLSYLICSCIGGEFKIEVI